MQVHSDIVSSAPFLVLNEKKKMMLLPSLLLHKEAPDPRNSSSWTDIPHASMEIEFPLESWIHIGCEVWFRNLITLAISCLRSLLTWGLILLSSFILLFLCD